MQKIVIEHIAPTYYDISKGYFTEDDIDEKMVEKFKQQLHKAIDSLTFDDFIDKNNDWGGVHFATRAIIITGKNGKE